MIIFRPKRIAYRKGTLSVQTFRMYQEYDKPADYLRAELFVPEEFYPTVFGLRFAEDFDIGKE